MRYLSFSFSFSFSLTITCICIVRRILLNYQYFLLLLFFFCKLCTNNIFFILVIDKIKKNTYVVGMETQKKNNTTNGFNVRVTPKTMELLGEVKNKIAEVTGVNQPMSAIVGQLVHDKAVELGVADEGCNPV